MSDTALAEPRPFVEAHKAIGFAANVERDAERAYRAATENRELRRELWNAQSARRAAREQLYKLQAAERDRFAASREWRVYKGRQGWIYTEQLIAGRMIYGDRGYPGDVEGSDVIDHRECFMRSPPGKTSQQSCRYPVAILSHTYGEWEPCVEFARRYDLSVERLPYSWYYPGNCIAALFLTRAVLN